MFFVSKTIKLFLLKLHDSVCYLYATLYSLKWRGVERRSLCYVNVKSHFSGVVLLFFTWCTQRMSALGRKNTVDMATNRMTLPQGTTGRHLFPRGFRERTPRLHQCTRNHQISCGCSAMTSNTHDTARSNQQDSHSLRVS